MVAYLWLFVLFLRTVLKSGMNYHDFVCVCAYFKWLCQFLGQKKGLYPFFFWNKIGLFPATFIPISGIICYSKHSVPESHMNVPESHMNVQHFVVICHFTSCHTHFDYVIIQFLLSDCAKFRMCFPKLPCTSPFYIWHIHILFGTLLCT